MSAAARSAEDSNAAQSASTPEKRRPRRVYARTKAPADIDEDVRLTLLEYGAEAQDVVVRAQLDDHEPGRERKKQLDAQFLANVQVEKLLTCFALVFAATCFQIAEQLKAELQAVDSAPKKISSRVVTELIDASKLEQVASTSEGLEEIASARTAAQRIGEENAQVSGA